VTKILRSYGFMIDTKTWADSPAGTARIMAREGDTPYPCNPRTESEHEIWDAPKQTHGLLLNDLVIRTYLSGPLTHRGRAVVIGPSIEFSSINYVDTKLAKAALRTLERIDRAIARAHSAEAGDVIMAIAQAIGAEWYAHRVGDQPPSFSYAQDQWRFAPVTEARDVYRAAVEKLRETKREVNRNSEDAA
jgi:hypothetical protein